MDAERRQSGLMMAAAGGVGLAWVAGIAPTWQASADLGHAWLAPLLVLYLWWERWDERPGLAPAGRHVTRLLLLVTVALLIPLRLLLTPYPLWPMATIAYTAGFAALALLGAHLVAGRAGVRWMGGPLLILASALPLPSFVETSLILPLRETMAVIAAEVCNLLGRPAIASGTSIQLANAWVGVEEACSGIRSLQACAMMGLFFGEWFRFSAGRRALLVLLGLAAALAGNLGRVLFLSLAATRGTGVVDTTHDLAGWIAMLASLIATGWLAFAWGGYRLPETMRLPRTLGGPGNAAGWLMATAVVVVATDLGTRLWYAHGEVARDAVPQWTVRLPSEHGTFQSRPLAEAAREMLRPDHYLAGGWRSGDTHVESYYIEWQSGQVARSIPFLHNPTVCLPYAGCELVGALPPLQVSWERGTLEFFVYRFRRGNDLLLVAFTIWDPSRGQPLQRHDTGSWAAWWRRQWRDVAEARQHQPAQLLTVALSLPAEGIEKTTAAQTLLSQTIGRLIVRLPPGDA